MAIEYRLFTEDVIKQWYTKDGTTDYRNETESDQLQVIVNGIAERFEQYCNCKFEYSDSHVEYINPSGNALFLNIANPIAITSIVPRITGAYDDSDPVDESEYYLEDNAIRLVSGCCWSYKKYKVTYEAGYDKYGTESPENPLPSDLVQAALIQLRFDWENRDNVGIQSRTDDSGNSVQFDRWGLMSGVKTILDKYRIL